MSTIFQVKTRVDFGPGQRFKIADQIKELRGERVLFVADKGLYDAGMITPIIDAVKKTGIVCDLFTDIDPDPTELTIDRGVQAGIAFKPDVLVIIGGGSAICAGKAIALVLANGGKLTDLDLGTHKKAPTPTVVLPSTAGSGTEVAPRFLIKDSQTHVKRRYGGADCYPTIAVLDPELIDDLPASIAIASSLDAISSAIEAYTSTEANLITDTLALGAIRSLWENMGAAGLTSSNKEAKSRALIGSTMANMACGNAKVGLVHGLTYGPFNVSHGVACGIMLPFVMKYITPACEPKMANIAEVFGHKRTGDLLVDSKAAVERLKEFYVRVDFPRSLKDLGMKEELLDELVDVSMKQVHLKTSIRRATRKDVENIFIDAFKGW